MLRYLLSRLRTRRELARLSDRALRDIGVAPEAVRLPFGPSPLVLQPALLAQSQDRPDAATPASERPEARGPLWIIHLRAPATRPI